MKHNIHAIYSTKECVKSLSQWEHISIQIRKAIVGGGMSGTTISTIFLGEVFFRVLLN